MRNKICVYTCITGDYDNLLEINNPEKEIDYYCFTNNRNLKSRTWKIIQISDQTLDNCRLARKIKTVGHDIVNNYEIAVWTDADVVWEKPITKFVSTFLKNTSLTIFKHHERDTIYDEAIACLRLRKDSKEKIINTLELYKKESFPDTNGLCESTVFIKKPQNEKVKLTMDVWYSVIKNYSRRDQLSFNYAAWKTGIDFSYIKENVWDNKWFSTVRHNSKKDITECHVYYGNPDVDFNFSKYFIYKYQIKDSSFSFQTIIPFDTEMIELNPSDIVGTIYNKLSFKPSPNKVVPHGIESNIACIDHHVFRILGNFKKGEKLAFSANIETMNTTKDYLTLIEKEWRRIEQLSNNIESIKGDNKSLQSRLNQIENNKLYKLYKKSRSILPK